MTDSQMIDPVLKIVLSKGRFEFGEATQGFSIDYDPTIEAGQLWRKLTEDEIRDQFPSVHLIRPLNDLVPAISFDRTRILSLVVGESDFPDELILELDYTESQFFFYKNSISNKNIPNISKYFSHFIDYIFDSIFMWYKSKQIVDENFRSKKITMLLRRGFAVHLPSSQIKFVENSSSGYCVFRSAEVNS